MEQYKINIAGELIFYKHHDTIDKDLIKKLSEPYPCFHLELRNLEKEEWKEYKKDFWEEGIVPAKNNNKYSKIDQVFVSNKGRVKFIEDNCEKIIAQKEISDKKGYRCLKLDKYPLFEPIHRMVIQTWTLSCKNDEPKEFWNGEYRSYIVHHIDNNHWNNCIENLIYVSSKIHGMIKHP